MRPLATARLVLRNWKDRDRALFHRINSDDRVMEFFAGRRDRAAADAFLDVIRAEIARDGYGFAAVELAETGECIGFTGIVEAELDPLFPADMIEIGWRIVPEHWGKGYVTEAADRWLAFGFETLGLQEIVSFAVGANRRSTAVMERLGMRRDPASDFDHPKVPDSHPHLKRHVMYRLARQDWLAAGPRGSATASR
ncbi:MAG: GNAT family N-acetyltransferase [Rhizobiaceae bacterium]|nr:GNAT family N-acetyltransferase [Rhizobiaceae bacterium]